MTDEVGIRDELVEACPMARLVYLAMHHHDADETPLTAATLQTETLSPRQSVLDGLNALRERDLVEQVDDETDPPTPRYTLIPSRDS